jgi:hypothetical protein
MLEVRPSVTTLDPTYEAFTAPERMAGRSRAPALASLRGLRIGLLANGKTNSEALLDAVYDELARYPTASLSGALRVCKSSVSVPPEPEDFRRLVAETDAVLVAIGD